MTEKMRAMEATRDGVKMIEIPKPIPGRGEVRIKVIASAVNAGEDEVISGSLVGRFIHAPASPLVLGWDFAGTVDALGDGFHDSDYYLERDGLAHYREATCDVGERWCDPWQTPSDERGEP